MSASASRAAYRPAFRWREIDGEHCIVDGDTVVARFYPGTSALPSAPSAALRPVSLHDVRLTPDGPLLIGRDEVCGPLCLSWRKHLIFNMEIDDLRADDIDPGCFKLYVRTRDTALRADQPGRDDYRPDAFLEETWLELTYDPARRGYVYDVATRLTLRPGRLDTVLAHDLRGLEFGDILPAGAHDQFPPAGNKRYTHTVCREPGGQLWYRPQNRCPGELKMDVYYAANGFLAFVAEAQGNPVVEFVNGCGSLVRSEICWAMYDVHFKMRQDVAREALAAGEPLDIHYRLYSLDYETAADLLVRAAPDPVLARAELGFPVFVPLGSNRFTDDDTWRRPSDRWFWVPTGEGCRWNRQAGELILHHGTTAATSSWGCAQLFASTPRRATACVRCAGVTGAVRLELDGGEAVALTGTHGWAELTATAPAPQAVRIVLDGPGTVAIRTVEIV